MGTFLPRTLEKATMTIKRINCLVVGDWGTGKRSLVQTYTEKTFPEYVSCLPQSNPVSLTVQEQPCQLDLATIDDSSDHRSLCYASTDVFLICFSVVSATSAENVKEKWVHEIQHHCPGTPFLLVGTQTDLTEDWGTSERLACAGQTPTSLEMGAYMASEIGAAKYFECSAKKRKGLEEIFEAAAMLAMTKPRPWYKRRREKNPCTFL